MVLLLCAFLRRGDADDEKSNQAGGIDRSGTDCRTNRARSGGGGGGGGWRAGLIGRARTVALIGLVVAGGLSGLLGGCTSKNLDYCTPAGDCPDEGLPPDLGGSMAADLALTDPGLTDLAGARDLGRDLSSS